MAITGSGKAGFLANGVLSGKVKTKQPDQNEEKTNLEPAGSLSTTKILYAGPEDAKGRFTWSDTLPEHIQDAAENEETAQHAIIVRKQQSFDSRCSLSVHSIIVQSPLLKKALGQILKDYPGIACELDRLEFDAPFECFVHRWPDILEFKKKLLENGKLEGKAQQGIGDTTQDDRVKTMEHLDLLFDVLQEELKDTIKAFTDFLTHGICTFEHIWTIFQPGSIVLSAHAGALSAYELTSGDYIQTQCGQAFRLQLQCIIWDGEKFGRYLQSALIYKFKGIKDVMALNAFPLAFHPDCKNLKKVLVERGKKAESLAGYHYKAYDGTAISWDKEGKPEQITTTGRIIVDTHAFNRFSQFQFQFQKIHSTGFKETDAVSVEEEAPNTIMNGTQGSGLIIPTSKPKVKLSESLHLIFFPLVRGYSLKSKRWMAFFVDLVAPIQWNEDAFSSLVLPPDKKDLVMSISECQTQSDEGFDDVIAGKGKGIVMLLSGPPGVGKTLTAESVSENMKTPLYIMSAGDLGVQSDQVEQRLSKVMQMVHNWNAVLLLDECDVFLEARSTHDLERNKLVSIFLRTLEYYEGILFLTTNRQNNIDAAFQSRIHVSLAYSELSDDSKKKVWKNFLTQGRAKHELIETDLEELSKEKLNGRQIKNVLKTARLLVRKRGGVLRRDVIETVLAIEKGQR